MKKDRLIQQKVKGKKSGKKHNAAARYINKWLALLASIIAVSGVFGFGLVAYIANLIGETADTYNPIWMVYMIPVMLVIAAPMTVMMAKLGYKHFNKLTEAMTAVVNGEKDVHIPTGGAGAFGGIYEDFNKMAAEIAGVQRLRGEITDSFSHELKTPIASINGFARLLLEKDLTEEKRIKYLEIIVKESDRLAELSANNLYLSKLYSQEIVADKEPYNIGQQLQEIAIAMEPSWAGKNINLTAELDDVVFDGNANLMESLWQNLLTNAIKFTPKNGDITITLTADSDEIIVSFVDSGIGMSEEVKERIFESYYQGDTSHSGKGHGLGLSIAKRIVRLCDGRITVSSQENEGSTFTVILPKN